ncbi:MAG TPA: hypothetical protein VFQ06_05545, partial [Nitrospira sp.]|nr:hypothetical protein [Nitrospira sp.]
MARRSQDRSMTVPPAGEHEPDRTPPDTATLDAATASGDVARNGLAPPDSDGLATLEEETRRRLEVESTLQDSEARYRLLYDNNPS